MKYRSAWHVFAGLSAVLIACDALAQEGVVTVICAKPDTVFAQGRQFVVQEDQSSSMSPIVLQLNKREATARFKRSGQWSPWSSAAFSDDGVTWDLVSAENPTSFAKGVLSNFQYWRFSLDLINRRVFEHFVEKNNATDDEDENASETLARGFSYPNCNKIDPMRLD